MKERISRSPNGVLTYHYTTSGGEMSFNFHLLSEVGAPYQPTFKTLLVGKEVQFGVSLRMTPWVADCIDPKPDILENGYKR